MNQRSSQHTVENPKRRLMLTFGLTGIVAFFAGKMFGDTASLFQSTTKAPVNKTEFSNFVFTETGREMVLSDKEGDPIFIIDKESFSE